MQSGQDDTVHCTPLPMKNDTLDFTPAELRKLRSLKDPVGIQRYLDDLPYHLGDTAGRLDACCARTRPIALKARSSPQRLCARTAIPPLIIDFEAEHDTDHVLAVYK